MTWQEFLVTSEAEMARNELDHGVTYTPPERKRGDAPAAVREYLAGYGWRGVSAGEVSERTGYAFKHVRKLLDEMVADGEATMEEQVTRGAKASRRKAYFSLDPRALASADDIKLATVGVADTYFKEEAWPAS